MMGSMVQDRRPRTARMLLSWLCPGITATEGSIIIGLRFQQALDILTPLLNLAHLCNLVILVLILVQASGTSTIRWLAARGEGRLLVM